LSDIIDFKWACIIIDFYGVSPLFYSAVIKAFPRLIESEKKFKKIILKEGIFM